MKKIVFTVFTLGLVITGATVLGVNANASTFENYESTTLSIVADEDGNYALEDMLTYAILDEINAKATYEAFIEVYGDINPFAKIVVAEQTHIDLLLPLLETYGVEVPTSDYVVVVPETIEEALAAGVEAEIANIALYESFLAQTDLPEDVAAVFELLVNASEHHLAAFSKDHVGTGMGQGSMGLFKGQGGQGKQNKGANGSGYDGVCIND